MFGKFESFPPPIRQLALFAFCCLAEAREGYRAGLLRQVAHELGGVPGRTL